MHHTKVTLQFTLLRLIKSVHDFFREPTRSPNKLRVLNQNRTKEIPSLHLSPHSTQMSYLYIFLSTNSMYVLVLEEFESKQDQLSHLICI